MIPIGIILMLIAGQIATYLVPEWSIAAGMQSNLDPNNLPQQQAGLLQPVLPAILTPLGWFETFLTPGASDDGDVSFPPFLVFQPSATSAPTATPLPVLTASPAPTATPIVTLSPSVTPTKKTPDVPTDTPSPTPKPPVTPPPVTSTLPSTNPTLVPAPPGIIDDPSLFPPYDSLDDNQYIVIDLGANGIVVTNPADVNYDMVYYEMQNWPSSQILLDQVIIGISNEADGSEFYTVFYWGDDTPDLNSNVGDVAAGSGTEDDNAVIPLTELYGSTGIVIDVDNADSHPPSGSYRYIVLIVPVTDDTDGDGLNMDAIDIVEVPISSVAGKPRVLPARDVPAAAPVENPPAAAPVENPPAAAPVENPPAAAPVENPPDAAPVENPPAAAPVENPPAAAPVENPPAAAPVENPPAAAPVENPPAATP
jgi:hypothetical protein